MKILKMRNKHVIIFEKYPSIQSQASLILLNHHLRELDDQGNTSTDSKSIPWKKKIEFSRDFLSRKQKQGKLECHYCKTRDISIEYFGMKLEEEQKATIDHINPLSKGGLFYDETNIVVACGRCNTKKGNRDYQEFVNSINVKI